VLFRSRASVSSRLPAGRRRRRAIEVSHAAVKFGAIDDTVKIISALEESDCPSHGRLWITVRTVCIVRRRGAWPLGLSRATLSSRGFVGSDVGLARLRLRMLVVSFVSCATTAVLIFIGEAESSVAHLMDRDLERTQRLSKSRDWST